MAFQFMPLSTEPWTPGAHPLEKKRVGCGGAGSVVQLRFEPGFADPEWCRRSHVLIVVEGELSVQFEDQTVRVLAGEVLKVDPETPHRAANPGSVPTVLFAVSELE